MKTRAWFRRRRRCRRRRRHHHHLHHQITCYGRSFRSQLKPGFHIIVRIVSIAPVVSKLVQAIRAITWKRSKNVTDD